MRFAAIDLGTVTCRLLVADVFNGQIVPLAKEYAIINLGEGVDKTHLLASEALERTWQTLQSYLKVCERFNTPEDPLVSITCVATSASRDAENSAELEAVFNSLGLEVQIISGEREAELTFLGVASAFVDERLVVVDVGGGSTEIICGTVGAGVTPAIHVDSVRSYDIGSRRLTERFLESDPPTERELDSARIYISGVLAGEDTSAELNGVDETAWCNGAAKLVAVAGTATSVVSVRDAMDVYDASRVHGAVVQASELDAVAGKLAALPLAQRAQIVGLDPGRAPVIVAGLLILQEVMQNYRQASFTVSESDILSGIIIAEYERARGLEP